jgi:hypothetical protein
MYVPGAAPPAVEPRPAPAAASPPDAVAPPAWAPQRPRSSAVPILIAVAAVVVLAVIAGGLALWALQPAGNQTAAGLPSAEPSTATTSATPSAVPSPSPSLVAAQPLTARLAGDYCPVRHVGDSACWKGSVVNTGPPIQNLAMIFIVGSPYSNWFATHSNGTLSGFFTSPGCQIDAAHSRIVCGPVAAGQEVDAYLGGDVSKRGAFNYGIKFADIGGGSPVYINQHANGTHDAVTWREVID